MSENTTGCAGCAKRAAKQRQAAASAEGPSMQEPSFADPLGIGPAVDREFERWIGTPHGPHQRVRGPRGGVDCVNVVAAVFDRLFRLPEPTDVPEVGMLSSLHRPGAAQPVIKALIRAYKLRRVYVAAVEPGDLYFGRADGRDPAAGEGHVLIQMGDRLRIGHSASPNGPQFTALSQQPDVMSVWRSSDREGWA